MTPMNIYLIFGKKALNQWKLTFLRSCRDILQLTKLTKVSFFALFFKL